MANKQSSSILYLSTYPPRECGIATFTKDLAEAVQRKYNPALKPRVLALNNDVTDLYAYDRQVVRQITANNIEDYITLARELNETEHITLIHIQHEFGLFGGDWGDYLIPFLQTIHKPVVVTFHTILPNPDRMLSRVVRLILQHSKAVIVMNQFSKQILVEAYQASPDQISVIPHGIPYIASSNGQPERKKLGVQDYLVLSTFGLLSPGKGIEYALRALPPVVKKHPNLLYLVVGVTHPTVRKHAGETYRNFLHAEVQRLGLQNHVKFYNKYLGVEELLTYLKSSDLYVSPGLDRNQSVSGTLSYALGCGTPVVCTESLYAKSVVTPETGVLVKPKNASAISKAILELCADQKRLKEMGKTAFAETRHMTWPNVALGHFQLYKQIAPSLYDEQKLPEFTLQHMRKLTDDFGIIQFATQTEPNLRFGYSIDDNARAAIVAAMAHTQNYPGTLELLRTYVKFLSLAQRANGSFANLVNGKRKIPRQELSEDAQGRTIWALGYLASCNNLPPEIRNKASAMLKKSFPAIRALESPRAIAFATLGLYFSLQAKQTASAMKLLQKLADQQVTHYLENAEKEWLWFEESLTYSNSKLPESLFYAYLATRKKSYLTVAEKSLGFLVDATFGKGHFSPIGQNGWFARSGERAYFDQQPEDASSMVQTLLVARKATGNAEYRELANDAFQWFLGKNHLNQMVYDEATGGCYDGLGQHTLNLNQGAESTISYLLARLALEES